MLTREIKEKLKRELRRQINSKIRLLEVRIFTNAQAAPTAGEIFSNTFNDSYDALAEIVSENNQRHEINNVIHISNQHIIKLKLMKKLLTDNNAYCVFKCLADDKYQQINLKELNELLGISKMSCEKEQPKVLTKIR